MKRLLLSILVTLSVLTSSALAQTTALTINNSTGQVNLPAGVAPIFPGIPVAIDSATFGMVGDGATDNTTALQNALNAAAASASKTLLIRSAASTYNFSGTVTIPVGITIMGESTGGDIEGYTPWPGNPYQVRLKYTGTSDAFYMPEVSANKIENIEIDGSVSALGAGISASYQLTIIGAFTSGSPNITSVGKIFETYPRVGMVLVNGVNGIDDSSPVIPAPVSTTATFSSGSTTITVASATGLAVGMAVTNSIGDLAPGIQAGTRISAISGTTVTLSKATTASGSSEGIVFSTAIVSYTPGTGGGTIVMSNNAINSRSYSLNAHNILAFDPYHPNGISGFGCVGQHLELRHVLVTGFGMAFTAHNCEYIDVDHCYLGDSKYAGVMLTFCSDPIFSNSYVGGLDSTIYQDAYGFYLYVVVAGSLNLKEMEINQCGTAIYGLYNVKVTILGNDFEWVGFNGHPEIRLDNGSHVTGIGFHHNVSLHTSLLQCDDTGSGATFINVLPGYIHGVTTSAVLNGTTTITVADASVIAKGDLVYDGTQTSANVVLGTYVTNISGTTITLSQAAASSATVNLSFSPPVAKVKEESQFNTTDIPLNVFAAITDVSGDVSSTFVAGQSATLITHGVLGSTPSSSVSVPANIIDAQGGKQLYCSQDPGHPSLAAYYDHTSGIILYGGATEIVYNNNQIWGWNWFANDVGPDDTNWTAAIVRCGKNTSANHARFTQTPSGSVSSGLGFPTSGGVSLVGSSLDVISVMPTTAGADSTSGAVPDIRMLRTMTASGTDGARTINTPYGSVQFAAAASSLVVTSSLCHSTSHIQATVGSHDANHPVVSVVAGSGSFTIYLDPAPAAETQVNFSITN
jgi:hypothetical protein